LISSIIRLSLSFVKNAVIPNSIIKNHPNLPISLIYFLDDDQKNLRWMVSYLFQDIVHFSTAFWQFFYLLKKWNMGNLKYDH